MRRRNQRGSALIEAAVVLPVMGLVLCASIDIGRVLQLGQVASAAARAGVHRALFEDAHTVDLKVIEDAAVADAGLPGFSAKASRVCACGVEDPETRSCDLVKCGASRWSYIQVDTQVELKPMMKYPWIPAVVRGQALMRVE